MADDSATNRCMNATPDPFAVRRLVRAAREAEVRRPTGRAAWSAGEDPLQRLRDRRRRSLGDPGGPEHQREQDRADRRDQHAR
jgi:hypothetical protein